MNERQYVMSHILKLYAWMKEDELSPKQKESLRRSLAYYGEQLRRLNEQRDNPVGRYFC